MPHKVLIIDDEDDIREVAALSLESVAGWDVVTASSGAQGLARAIEHQPDAILLDAPTPQRGGAGVRFDHGRMVEQIEELYERRVREAGNRE